MNPMTAPVEMVREGLLGTGGAPATSLAVTLGTVAVLMVGGLWFFGRSEAAALDSL
jgi:ABC-type polysaccharide/polyol phosphate export permease